MFVILLNYLTLSQMSQVTTYQIRSDDVYVLISRDVKTFFASKSTHCHIQDQQRVFANFSRVFLSVK